MIDLFFLIAAGYGFFLGFYRGIIQTIFTILSYVFATLAAFKLSPATSKFLETATGTEHPLMFLAGFLIAFFGTMFLIRFISRAISEGMEAANVNIINQMAGGLLLASLMTLVYSLMLWFAAEAHILQAEYTENSLTYPFLKEYPKTVWNALGSIKPVLKDFWEHSVDFMDRIEEVSIEKTESDPNVYDIPDDQ